MARMRDSEIVALLRLELEQSEGYDADELADKRAKALEYYYGVMPETGDGRSNIVSHDVADSVHSLMAQMPDIFRASAVEFPGMNEEDEKQAELESDTVRAILEANDEFETFDAAAHDGLTIGNAWIGVTVIEDEQNETVSYQDMDDIRLAALMGDLERSEWDYQVQNSERHKDGVDVTLQLSKVNRSLEVRAVGPERMIYTQAEDYADLQTLRLVAERRRYTMSELMDLGLSEFDASSIPSHTDDWWPGDIARESGKSNVANYNSNENEHGGHQEAEHLKETFVCYFMLDINEDGHSERYRIHFGGSVLIEIEPYYCVPYVTGSPLPVPHRIPGLGMYEIMHQIQDGKTDILRSYIDNLDVMNQGRVGYLEGYVNLDDLTDSRMNGAVACTAPNAVWPLPATDIGQQAVMGLNYLDQVRTQRGGASLDIQQGNMQVAQQSALGASLEYESKESMAGLYCKNMAQGLLKGAFLLVHKVLRAEWNAPIDAKVRGKWLQVNPSEWPERTHARISVGMTNSEKMAMKNDLTQLITQQVNFITNGQAGIFTDNDKLFNAISAWIRVSDLTGNPLEYITDPSSEEAQQAAQAAAQAAQQQAAAAEKAADDNRELLLMIEQVKSDTDKWQTEMTTRFDYYKANLDAGIKTGEAEAAAMIEGAKLEAAAQAPVSNGADN